MTRATLSLTVNRLPSWNSALLVACGSEEAILVDVLKVTCELRMRELNRGLALVMGLERVCRLVRQMRELVRVMFIGRSVERELDVNREQQCTFELRQ